MGDVAACFSSHVVPEWADDDIEAALAHLGGDLDRAWARCVEWHGRAAAHGLAAEAETPSTGLISDVLDACEEALHARGLGEEAHLAPLRRRAMKRESPAPRASAALYDVGHVDLVPGQIVHAVAVHAVRVARELAHRR